MAPLVVETEAARAPVVRLGLQGRRMPAALDVPAAEKLEAVRSAPGLREPEFPALPERQARERPGLEEPPVRATLEVAA